MARDVRGNLIRWNAYGGGAQHGGKPAARKCQRADGDYTEEETAFMLWMEAKKRMERTPFPDCRTILRWSLEFGLRKEPGA